MKKYVVIGAIGLAAAVAGGGATYAVLGGEADEPLAEVGDVFPGRGGLQDKSRVASPSHGGAEEFGRHSEVIEQLEIGMSYAEVLAIVGPADHEEVMSSTSATTSPSGTGPGGSSSPTKSFGRSTTTPTPSRMRRLIPLILAAAVAAGRPSRRRRRIDRSGRPPSATVTPGATTQACSSARRGT